MTIRICIIFIFVIIVAGCRKESEESSVITAWKRQQQEAQQQINKANEQAEREDCLLVLTRLTYFCEYSKFFVLEGLTFFLECSNRVTARIDSVDALHIFL
jgi:hypothetical protein